jgi:glycolate oxidase FAD binding subunit
MVTRLRPTGPAELSEAVREGDRRLLVAGAGTAAGWGGTPADVDAVLDTTGLDGVVDYQPADMTVAVRAGMPLADLQKVLAEHGQRIALDAARIPLGATVGGLVATADGGPARHAYGTLRDTVIGITVVLADGTVARSGGYVIKNVAGYDLAKLFHGSLGTLGVIAEVVLRVYPIPKATRTVAVECPPDEGFDLAGRIVASALEPAALEWFAGRLLVRFEGTAQGVARRAAMLSEVGEAGWCEVDGAVWDAVASVAVGEPGGIEPGGIGPGAKAGAGVTVFRSGTLPSRMPWFATRLAELAGDSATLSSSVGVGVHTARLRSGDPAADAAVFATLRDEVAAAGGSTTAIRRAGDVPAWGPPPPAVALMRAVKQKFDPGGRLGAGRFAPWF